MPSVSGKNLSSAGRSAGVGTPIHQDRLGTGSNAGRGLWRPMFVLVAIFAVLVLPMLAIDAGGTSEQGDELEYHLPIIRTMAGDWPDVNLVEYESATTPGFHLFMAAVLRATDSLLLLKILNAGFGVGFLLAVFVTASRFAPPWGALLLTLPLAFDPYVLGASIWLTTDNAAMMFVALALGGSALGTPSPARSILLGVFAAAAAAIRQIHVWLAAPIGLAGLLLSPLGIFAPRLFQNPARSARGTWSHLAGAVVGAALPFALVLYFAWSWGWQLMPRCTGWVKLHSMGPNPAAPAFALALIGVIGVFFLPFISGQILRLSLRDRMLWFTLVIAAAVALIPETSYLWKSRSYGWLWRIVERFPEFGERSIVISLAAPAGALVLLLLYRAAADAGRRVPAAVLLLSLLGWLCAQTFNSMAWQRYFEPMTLMGLGWLAALGCAPATDAQGALRARLSWAWPWVGPFALAAVQFALSAITTYREAITFEMNK